MTPEDAEALMRSYDEQRMLINLRTMQLSFQNDAVGLEAIRSLHDDALRKADELRIEIVKAMTQQAKQQ